MSRKSYLILFFAAFAAPLPCVAGRMSRMEGPDDFSPFADIGAWSRENPPQFNFFYDLPHGPGR